MIKGKGSRGKSRRRAWKSNVYRAVEIRKGKGQGLRIKRIELRK
ncbi:hypothetical protein [Gottschalkia acidurici]|nr:hypothetical protein [Gottschalkia acidurici]